MSFYEIKVVSRAGAVLATFDADVGDGDTRQKASILEVTWQLNEPGLARISVPVFHPAASEIQALTREIQVWRNGVVIFWGVPVQRSLNGGSIVWECPGVLWYLTRRYFGPISIQYLTNPDFATNLSGWTTVGATSAHSTAIRIRGPGTAELFGAASGDNYLEQVLTVSTGSIGLYLTFAAWYWLDTSPGGLMASPALEQRGIYIQSDYAKGGPAANWEPITMNGREAAGPHRVETHIQLAENLPGNAVKCRLYAPNGRIRWGACSVTEQESVSASPGGTDCTEMMRRIVDYAQNGTGKSTLSIGTSTPACGITEMIAYQFYDLANIFATLQTYPARGLADFDVALTSTTKTFTTYAPRKGSLKSGSALSVPGSSVLQLGHHLDGGQTASKTIRRGAAEGSDRELGVATDTGPLAGLVLEDVADAPPEIGIDGLQAYATTSLAAVKGLVTLPDLTVAAEGFLGAVVTGDTIPVTIDWGAVQETVDRRVMRLTLSPASDTLAVGVGVA